MTAPELAIHERLERIEALLLRLAGDVPAAAVVAPPPPPVVVGGYGLTDDEIRMYVAQRGMSAAEEKIFRMRQMAFRLGRDGKHDSARRMRGRADGLERRLDKELRRA